ncbi:Uncharacterised protein [Flavobacterium hibernum]|nr:Uncharacterised protein [Flavobacterium hibernum]
MGIRKRKFNQFNIFEILITKNKAKIEVDSNR